MSLVFGKQFVKSHLEDRRPGKVLLSTVSRSPIIRIGLPLRVNIFVFNCTTSFYGLNVSPVCQIHVRNYALMFCLYLNKYVS